MRTAKGYTLTEDQAGRRGSLMHFAQPGPGYRRSVRDNLASLQYAEDGQQVEYFLRLAERAAK